MMKSFKATRRKVRNFPFSLLPLVWIRFCKVSEESLHQILRAFLFLPTVIILPFVP